MQHIFEKTFTIIICGCTLITMGCASGIDLTDSQTKEIGVPESSSERELPSEIEDTSPLPTELPAEITEPTLVGLSSPLARPTVPLLPTGIVPLPGSELPLATALADLSDHLRVPSDQISLVSIEAIEWRDTSLGCPQEGFMYAQVITSGYLIVFEVEGVAYSYHTDTADHVIHCTG